MTMAADDGIVKCARCNGSGAIASNEGALDCPDCETCWGCGHLTHSSFCKVMVGTTTDGHRVTCDCRVARADYGKEY